MNYSGIGSRKIDTASCNLLKQIASRLENQGYCLRSGGAIGADQAFESGIKGYNKTIFLPNDATYESIQMAKQFHPAWDSLNTYVRKLMGRNCQIILGENLDSPSLFVLCWTLDETIGGTSHGIKVARHYKIPVFNLANPLGLQEFSKFILERM